MKTDEEILMENATSEVTKEDKYNFDSIDSYLEAVKKEPFKDSNFILIDPDINIKEKFD